MLRVYYQHANGLLNEKGVGGEANNDGWHFEGMLLINSLLVVLILLSMLYLSTEPHKLGSGDAVGGSLLIRCRQ